MPGSYSQAIAEARRRYTEAMDDAAADVLVIVERYDKPMATVCKDIAGDDWNALRQRAGRLAERAGQSPAQLARAAERRTREREQRYAKQALRNPETVAKVMQDPAIQATVRQAVHDQDERVVERQRSADSQPTPLGSMALAPLLNPARRATIEAARELAEFRGRISQAVADRILTDAAVIESALQLIRARVDRGEPIDWDAELESLTGGA